MILSSKDIETMVASLKLLSAHTETRQLTQTQSQDLEHITSLINEIRQKADMLSANLVTTTRGFNAAISEITDFGAPPIVRSLS